MDQRRLNTGEVLQAGILDITPPQTEIPHERDTFDEEDISAANVIAALEDGKLIEASNYYGIPYVWKQAEGDYRGCLLQYRQVTEDPRFTTAADAAAWFLDTRDATEG